MPRRVMSLVLPCQRVDGMRQLFSRVRDIRQHTQLRCLRYAAERAA